MQLGWYARTLILNSEHGPTVQGLKRPQLIMTMDNPPIYFDNFPSKTFTYSYFSLCSYDFPIQISTYGGFPIATLPHGTQWISWCSMLTIATFFFSEEASICGSQVDVVVSTIISSCSWCLFNTVSQCFSYILLALSISKNPIACLGDIFETKPAIWWYITQMHGLQFKSDIHIWYYGTSQLVRKWAGTQELSQIIVK